MTLSRDLEVALRNGFYKFGIPNVLTSVDEKVRELTDFPYIRIVTSESSPIHPNAIIHTFACEVAIVGPLVKENDKESTSQEHLIMHKQIFRILGRMMPNNILNKEFQLTNCQEVIPSIDTINKSEVWISGYNLTFN